MIAYIKTKFEKSDDQTNIDKYRGAANITKHNILSKLNLTLLESLFQNA